MLYDAIKKLVQYGINTGITPESERIYTTNLLLDLQKENIKTYAAHLRGENAYDEEDYTTGCAFLIGNEGNGLRDEVADCADCLIRIPMEGEAESLNAAVAAAVLMFEAGRQRRKK
mgnify:CR=1 FL=1